VRPLINAVCHRDYFEKGSNVLVEVFEDRLEISNPGGLPSGLSPKEFGSRSVARNPLLASLLQRIDFIEKIGTGIHRIRESVENHGGAEVEFRYAEESFTVVFRALKSSGHPNNPAS
jgi:ATP-dependent DNA helicase RecG